MRYLVAVVLSVALVSTSWAQAPPGKKTMTYQELAADIKKAETDKTFSSKSTLKVLKWTKYVAGTVPNGDMTIQMADKGSKPCSVSYASKQLKEGGGKVENVLAVANHTTKKQMEFRVNEKLGTIVFVADGHAADIKINADLSYTCMGEKMPDVYHALAYVLISERIRENLDPEIIAVTCLLLEEDRKTKFVKWGKPHSGVVKRLEWAGVKAGKKVITAVDKKAPDFAGKFAGKIAETAFKKLDAIAKKLR